MMLKIWKSWGEDCDPFVHPIPPEAYPRGWLTSQAYQLELWLPSLCAANRWQHMQGFLVFRCAYRSFWCPHMWSNCLPRTTFFLEIELGNLDGAAAASTSVNSRGYRNHPLVQSCHPSGEAVVPGSLYSDGVTVGESPHQDSLYVV